MTNGFLRVESPRRDVTLTATLPGDHQHTEQLFPARAVTTVSAAFWEAAGRKRKPGEMSVREHLESIGDLVVRDDRTAEHRVAALENEPESPQILPASSPLPPAPVLNVALPTAATQKGQRGKAAFEGKES